eukprot:CAMPEP_0204585880 /NCGR_PEP_ID=MMETSP0661-20131031/47171_1 /ASSEMBLY_ACC=CAM_ASM_000606 /TAXON_ID=109239 /ORGANISM="Alexandrium margalefi, Strain AMGDE01CS-322" /LENGTH=358 /DNA_ID=CAMNT_0051595469 /DNA_START=73 /DNA_END=1149 /DNA_ORIENTATION=+
MRLLAMCMLLLSARSRNDTLSEPLVEFILTEASKLQSRDLADLTASENRTVAWAKDVRETAEVMKSYQQEPWWEGFRSHWSQFLNESGYTFKERPCKFLNDWLGFQGPVVVPRLKLAFCLIPKVASTMFKDLFNALNHLNTTPGWGFDQMASRRDKFNLSMSDLTRENGWRFATFTRDPLRRYLSALGNTCLQGPGDHLPNPVSCCGSVSFSHATEDDVMENFGFRAGYDALHGAPYEEAHWAAQVKVLFFCGWQNFKPESLDFRGDISAGDVNGQVKDMLRHVGATAADLELVDGLFPTGSVAGHRSLKRVRPEAFYAQGNIAEAVKTVYAIDYGMLPGVGKHFTATLEGHSRTDEL